MAGDSRIEHAVVDGAMVGAHAAWHGTADDASIGDYCTVGNPPRMTFPRATWTTWMLALALSLSFSSCRLVSSLGKGQAVDLPYGKDTQLAYFEGQAHLLKGDLEDAYASFPQVRRGATRRS